jgi:hypothetical protein
MEMVSVGMANKVLAKVEVEVVGTMGERVVVVEVGTMGGRVAMAAVVIAQYLTLEQVTMIVNAA